MRRKHFSFYKNYFKSLNKIDKKKENVNKNVANNNDTFISI